MILKLPRQVITELARGQRRFHHYTWHRLRNAWHRLTESEQQEVCDINPAWVPPRPALDALGFPLRDNDSGEDFLFMSCQMIAFMNNILAEIDDPSCRRIEGWKRVPSPDDPDYPVPDFPDSGLEEVKSVQYYERFFAPWERRYTNLSYLSNVTLGQLGSDIEFTIHNYIHMRWAAPSLLGYRPTTAITQRIDVRWNDPIYNYLGDTYSSHVNPIFWKLQGWVVARIEDWKRAHAVEGESEWKGTWLGPIAHPTNACARSASAATGAAAAEAELRRIDGVISLSSGAEFDGFFRPDAQRSS